MYLQLVKDNMRLWLNVLVFTGCYARF
jgi:hypothetical protein